MRHGFFAAPVRQGQHAAPHAERVLGIRLGKVLQQRRVLVDQALGLGQLARFDGCTGCAGNDARQQRIEGQPAQFARALLAQPLRVTVQTQVAEQVGQVALHGQAAWHLAGTAIGLSGLLVAAQPGRQVGLCGRQRIQCRAQRAVVGAGACIGNGLVCRVARGLHGAHKPMHPGQLAAGTRAARHVTQPGINLQRRLRLGHAATALAAVQAV